MYLGIDLGTTNSAVAGNIDSTLRVFKSPEGTDVFPSAIYIDKRGHRLYGQRAYAQRLLSPDNVALGFKRLMGTSTPMEFAASGQSMTPEECSTEILRQLVGQAYTESGSDQVTGTVITIPAAFNQMQSEATLRSAKAAGLENAALLQEPIAAAMSAMSHSKNKSGQFLVYDLGGGTFDLALVQALNGSVNIVAHEGINMLGGRDFDKSIVNSVVRPWLIENFDLPPDFQKENRYRRVIRIAQMAVENARIAISNQETDMIFVSEDEVRVQDESGEDIYLEIELNRPDLVDLIGDRVEETIELSRKIVKENGYSHEDIDRLVFIGGPTKTPYLREAVPQQLGIPIDLQADPMTAVALGAAIYAESRNWDGAQTTRKASRSSKQAGGSLDIRFDFASRVATDRARLRVRASGESVAGNHEIQVDSQTGWTSGRKTLSDNLSIELPVADMGENVYKVMVFDAGGKPVLEASSEISITRTHASAQGIPATQNISVKVLDSAHTQKNVLDILIAKGTLLPTKGSQVYRAARDLKAGEKGHIEVEIFQQDRVEVKDPDLNLPIGVFRVRGDDLSEVQTLRKGDKIIFNWQMDDGGILTASVDLPSVGQSFDAHNYYVDQAGHRSFDGEDGTRIAASVISSAGEELDRAEDIAGSMAEEEIRNLRQRLERQHENLEQAQDADDKRSVTEESRRIRQGISQIVHSPQHRAKSMERELADLNSAFNEIARDVADPRVTNRFDSLGRNASREISRETEASFNDAEQMIVEMRTLMYQTMWSDPAFVIHHFKASVEESYRAADKELYAQQIQAGIQATEDGDIDQLRQIIFEMVRNQIIVGGSSKTAAALASIMRA